MIDLAAALTNINYLAVLTAAASSFLVGGLWYSPALFARPWQADNGLRDSDLTGAGPVFLGAFACAVVQSLVVAMFVGPGADAATGALAGLLVGLGLVAPALTCTFLFERRPRRLTVIDAGYHVVTFMLIGTIVGAWH
jgi:hypothetical protein